MSSASLVDERYERDSRAQDEEDAARDSEAESLWESAPSTWKQISRRIAECTCGTANNIGNYFCIACGEPNPDHKPSYQDAYWACPRCEGRGRTYYGGIELPCGKCKGMGIE